MAGDEKWYTYTAYPVSTNTITKPRLYTTTTIPVPSADPDVENAKELIDELVQRADQLVAADLSYSWDGTLKLHVYTSSKAQTTAVPRYLIAGDNWKADLKALFLNCLGAVGVKLKEESNELGEVAP